MSKVFCPVAWNSLSILPDGRLRLCCHNNEDHLLEDSQGHNLRFDEISGIQDLSTNKFLNYVKSKFSKNSSIPACESCIKTERLGQKSIRNELNEQFNQVSSESNFKLEYLDISFGNTCNMQCPMCSANYSSVWADLTNKPTKVVSHKKQIWETPFFADQIRNIKNVLIQGGEPFMSPEHNHFLDKLIDTGISEDISLDYITNFSIPISEKQIQTWMEFKNINIFISLEGVQDVYDYTRPPFKWSKLKKNLYKIKSLTSLKDLNINFNFKTMIQIYNLENIIDLIEFTSSMASDGVEVFPEFNLLTYPKHLTIGQLDKDLKDQTIHKILEYLEPKKIKFKGKSLQNYNQLFGILNEELKQKQEHLNENFWRHTKYFDIKYGNSFKNIISEKQYDLLKKKIK
jgi:MoaA/NifB/PqqE/SkfB family radical SAM enzyme